MNLNIEVVKTMTPLITPIISSVVEVWIKPKLQNIKKQHKLNNDLYANAFGEKFEEYIKRAYERNNIMNTVVFQNKPKTIEQLYIPLTLQDSQDKIKDILIDGYNNEIMKSLKKVVITDSAGMGKSTVLKRMFIDCVQTNSGVPIFIELRKLSEKNKIIDEIFNEINPIDDVFDRNFIMNLIKRGDFVFFLDGYDEIPLNERKSVTEDLQSFISKASDNIFILSSRPQTAIASFVDFHEFTIKPLEEDEAFQLIRKYDESKNIAEQLINIITTGPNSKNLEEFLTNPLMVSLLYKGYEYKNTIAYKKSIFYRQVYDALFENHDLSKGGAFVHEKASELDIEEFHTVLRTFAYITWIRGQIEYDRDEIIYFLNQAKIYTKIDFKLSDFLDDLVANVPLFYREGNHYRWKHKSLQEYFSAQYICTDLKERQVEVLTKIYNSENFVEYRNVLDLCYDIDYKTFRKSVIYKFICDATNFNKNNYRNFKGISSEDILARKKITFMKKYIFVKIDELKNKFNIKDNPEDFMAIHNKSYEYVEEVYKQDIKGYNFASGSLVFPSNFILFTFEKPNFSLSDLLLHKKEKFIESYFETPLSPEEYDILNEIFVSSQDGNQDTTSFIIDDNPMSIINQQKYFGLVNKYLKRKFIYDGFVKFELLQEIKEEIDNDRKYQVYDDLLIF